MRWTSRKFFTVARDVCLPGLYVARRDGKCARFCVGINACELMVRTTYALAYVVKEDTFSLASPRLNFSMSA